MFHGNEDEHWMKQALFEAEKAFNLEETPVGSVIVKDGRIIGRGGNRVETLHDPTAHAEILAIGAACETTGYERLVDTVMYVTLEPCPMCAGAIVLARIPRLVIGAFDPKRGACGSHINLCNDDMLNHRVSVSTNVLEHDCASLLNCFFQKLRMRKNNT